MGRPSPLQVRWKQQKAKARRGGYWGRGLMKGQQKGPFPADSEVFKGNSRAATKRHIDLCRLFDMSMQTSWMRLSKKIGPKLAKEGERAVYELFFAPIEKFEGNELVDLKMDIFVRQQQLWMLNNDPQYRFLRFNFVFLEGDEDSMFNLSLHFSGKEFFLVEKRINYLRRSSVYSDRRYLLDLHALGRVQWAAKIPIELSS